MQKEDGNKNLLWSNTRNQRQQIQPRRDIENCGVRYKIYCKDPIENGGHLSLLPNHSALFNSQPSTNRSQLLFSRSSPSLHSSYFLVRYCSAVSPFFTRPARYSSLLLNFFLLFNSYFLVLTSFMSAVG